MLHQIAWWENICWDDFRLELKQTQSEDGDFWFESLADAAEWSGTIVASSLCNYLIANSHAETERESLICKSLLYSLGGWQLMIQQILHNKQGKIVSSCYRNSQLYRWILHLWVIRFMVIFSIQSHFLGIPSQVPSHSLIIPSQT